MLHNKVTICHSIPILCVHCKFQRIFTQNWFLVVTKDTIRLLSSFFWTEFYSRTAPIELKIIRRCNFNKKIELEITQKCGTVAKALLLALYVTWYCNCHNLKTRLTHRDKRIHEHTQAVPQTTTTTTTTTSTHWENSRIQSTTRKRATKRAHIQQIAANKRD